ncbi:hypothetical protein F2P81_018768 [Scophthalmus maximus]|uniref:Pseudouridylate synthase PUS7L n=1 Tax=Scophthalmus maximus TaxID=52904 RepID=A0A6A4S5K2_SCOMX|nr:hypothetical protein F2P81_018768 [Scophthalmus maximus]
MQRSAVVVVADKTTLKRPFIFANAVHMALCFFMLTMTVAWHRDLVQTGKLVSNVSVVLMYVIEIGCLLLSVLGVFGAWKGKRTVCLSVQWFLQMMLLLLLLIHVCLQYATGMAAASQTIIVRTALSYQDIYEKRVVREETKLLSLMPLSATSKANRTLLYSIQEEIRLRGSATLGAPKNQYVYQEPCLPIYVSELKLAFSLTMAIQFGSGVFWMVLLVMSVKLMGQIKRKQEFMALLHSNRYVPGANVLCFARRSSHSRLPPEPSFERETCRSLDEVTMKQDSDAVNVPACFISGHEGFLGSIKNFIKDFVVTEIDISGQRVNKEAAAAAAAASHAPGCASSYKSNETTAECQQTNHSYVSHNAYVSADCGVDVALPSPGSFDLGVILGQSVSDELEQFVLTLKDEKPTQQELSLGSFADKHHRANVHRAVRHRFPFLMTVTIQPEIRVREDPDYRELSQLVTEDEAEDFFRFIDAKVRGSSYTFAPDDDKEHRTVVHHFLSRRFGKLVETKSFSDLGSTAISVRLRERGRPKKRSAEERKEEDVYTEFTLCKENLETLEAISYMAAALGVLPSDFTYAGIKDKRAITYQSMVVKKVSPQRLKEKRAEFEKRGMRLSQVRPVSEPLRLGRLQGNHFDLVVRDLRPHRARGFVNYYGPQRFGTGQSVQSDRVGLALLKEDMVSAVRLFFTPEEGDDPQSQAKRHFLQTDNAKESLALMPLCKARERLMLRALNRYGTSPDGCAQAWLSLPHSMRVFYPHAYCSRVWNDAVAHRLATLGHSARRGDLVWMPEGQSKADDGGETSCAQVLLPMPGNTVKYPENAMGTWYQERLARDGLEDCRFRVSGLKLNLPGCYRPLLALPRNLKYQLHGAACREGGGGEVKGDRKQDLPTLTLNFDLDSSCYATCVLSSFQQRTNGLRKDGKKQISSGHFAAVTLPTSKLSGTTLGPHPVFEAGREGAKGKHGEGHCRSCLVRTRVRWIRTPSIPTTFGLAPVNCQIESFEHIVKCSYLKTFTALTKNKALHWIASNHSPIKTVFEPCNDI